ncbi:hypothetical protein A3860_07355 [Niastella vici]|uniref:DUF2262 domain-containing protein n=1 Tax=Niastella vici TaxID=1703345 RepID=A0A1V9FIF1_9BACT|nr:DUF2004 domain-containing protein [Niastella vici]OQP58135.1 hypothetical protein A3860_07355 [Niastella vici]
MSSYTLPHFGEIDLSNLDEYYDVEIEMNGKEVDLDLNFEKKTVDPARLDIVKKFLEKLPEFDQKNKKYIVEDFEGEDNDTVATYVEHHLEELDEDELGEIIDFKNEAVEPEKQFIDALHLTRVGFYPDGDDQFAIFDYSIGRELTDYLVVIFTDENGELEYMTMES